jgi:hypothetical protein
MEHQISKISNSVYPRSTHILIVKEHGNEVVC